MRREEHQLYWIAGGLVAVMLLAIWLTGAISAGLFGLGWSTISTSELAATAIRLPSHLGNPKEAWPPGARASLPGPIGFYVTALIVFGGMGAGAALAVRGLKRTAFPQWLTGSQRRAPSARWAKPRELEPLRVKAPEPGRLTLGRSGDMLLAAEERQSVIAFAPIQTYKTSGIVIPAMLEWQGPVLATSVKNDLIPHTLARRQDLGDVMIFDPAQVTGMPRSRATPLWGATSWRGAKRVAHWLTAAAQLGSGLQDADFWSATARKLLAPLLFAAASNGLTVETVVRWLDEGPEASEVEIFELLEKADVEEAKRAFGATLNREERQRSSVYTTAEVVMEAFADPRVIEETSGAEYSPTSLLDGGANTLYLCAPSKEQERLRPLFSMLVQELLAIVEEIAAAKRGQLDPPLLLLLDEAANIAPIPDLDVVASTSAGQGVQLLTIFQDLAQVSVLYGRKAPTIFNNHAAKILGSGSSDRETLECISGIIGAGEFEQRSRTAGEGRRGSTTEGETYRDLAPPSLLRSTEPGDGILVYRHLFPTKISLRTWFEERTLIELAQGSGNGQGAKGV